MNILFKKLKLTDQKRILALNVPDHFQNDIDEEIADGVLIDHERMPSTEYDFAVTFVSSADELGAEAYMISKSLSKENPTLWISYSKSDSIDSNEAIEIMNSMNFTKTEEVQLDDDWSAFRFAR